MIPTGDDPSFGFRLQTRRLMRRLSQGQVARAAGIDHSTVSRLESGSRQPSPEMLDRLAAVFGCTPGDLHAGCRAGARRVPGRTAGEQAKRLRRHREVVRIWTRAKRLARVG